MFERGKFGEKSSNACVFECGNLVSSCWAVENKSVFSVKCGEREVVG